MNQVLLDLGFTAEQIARIEKAGPFKVEPTRGLDKKFNGYISRTVRGCVGYAMEYATAPEGHKALTSEEIRALLEAEGA